MLVANKSIENIQQVIFKQNNADIFTQINQNEPKNAKNTSINTSINSKFQKAFTEKQHSSSKSQKPSKSNRTILGQSQNYKQNNCVQEEFKAKLQRKEYLSIQNYSFRKLTRQYRAQALELLTYSFIEQEPLAKSFYQQFPEQKVQAYQFWEYYWDMYMDDAIESGISIMIVDTDKNDELVGAYTFKNFNYSPPNHFLDEKYLRGFNILSSQVVLQEELIHQSPHQVQDILLNSPLVAEAWGAAIKEQHTGKKLYSKMTALAQKILRQAGFEYALIFASNFLSSKVLKKLDFIKLSQVDCEQFQLMGNKPFALIQQLHKRPSLWFKELKDSQ